MAVVRAWTAACIVLFQIYLIGHIIYCKWNHYKNEKAQQVEVPLFLTELNRIEGAGTQTHPNRSNQNAPVHDEIKFNTSTYNTVLIEATHICAFIAFLAIKFVSRHLQQSFMDTHIGGNLDHGTRLVMYMQQHIPAILLTVVFPLLFYLTHPKIRNYVKGIVCKQTV